MNLPPISLKPDPSARREASLSSIVRACITKARGAHDRYVQSEWPDDRVAGLLLRSAQAPTSIADAAALATTAVYFVASLVPVSAAAAVIARSLQLSFDGAAHLVIPSLTLPQASFVAEGAAIPVVQGTASAGVSIEPYKLACLLALTNELVRHSNAEAVMRQVLAENVGPTLDAAMFSAAAAVPGLRPPGILNGITALTATTGGGLDAIVGDLKQIAAALAPVAGGGELILIVSPAQAAALAQLPGELPVTVLVSAALPAGEVIGLVPTAIATAVEAPRIETGIAGVIHLANPASDISTPGSPAVVAAETISLFQSDSISLRFILPATWARRSPSAIAWISGATW